MTDSRITPSSGNSGSPQGRHGVYRVMLVEDEPDMRILIRAVLTGDDRFEVSGEAASAADAVAMTRQTQPDLIVLDHSIEGDVMGLEAAPLLKQAAPDARIILFTAFDMAGDVAGEPAIDLFLSKTKLFDLLPAVLNLLELSA